MSKDIGDYRDIAKNKFAQAIDDLESASILYNAGKNKAANNRAYYAAFHAMDAVLALEPIAYKKHKDVIAHFNKKYVNKDIFSKDLEKSISKLEIIRHKSDYDDFYLASKEDTERQIKMSKEIIDAIKTYIDEQITD